MYCGLLSFGILALSILYVAFCLLVHFLAPECAEKPCQSEGVDNSVTMWSGDFFVAAATFLFGLHLSFLEGKVRKSGVLAQIFMAGSFALMGIGNWKYPNNALTDNVGMIGFWVVSAISSVFLTLSASCHAYFAIESSATISKLFQPCCSGLLTRFWLAGTILSCLANCIGCIWCANVSRLHTDDTHDAFADNLDFEERHVCIQMVGISEFLLWLSYALLWIPVGLLLKAAARKQSLVILGLSTSAAAGFAILFQWSTGAMYLVIVAFSAWIREQRGLPEDSFLELWERVYGAELFHFGVLLTMYCAHNLSWALTLPTMVRKVHKTTRESKMVAKSFLASEIDNAEKGIASDAESNSGNRAFNEQMSVASGETEETKASGNKKSTMTSSSKSSEFSALKQPKSVSKTVSFEESLASH